MSIVRKHSQSCKSTSVEVVYIDEKALIELIAVDLNIPMNEIEVEFNTNDYDGLHGAQITITKNT